MNLTEQYVALSRFLYGLLEIGVRVAACLLGFSACVAQIVIAVGGPLVAVIVIIDWIVGRVRSLRWNFTRASMVLSVLLFGCGFLWFADQATIRYALAYLGSLIPSGANVWFIIAWGVSSVLLFARTLRHVFPKPQLHSVRRLALFHITIVILSLLSLYGHSTRFP